MATKKCPNGHQYDSSIYGDNCPFCPSHTHVNEDAYKTRATVGGFDSPTSAPTAPFVSEDNGGGAHTVIRTIGSGAPDPDGGRKLVGLLVSYSQKETGEVFKIYEGRNVIGRAKTSDICFNSDDKMSSSHLLILYREAEGIFWAADQNSSNGTYVNGVFASERVKLQTNDIIVIGATKLVFLAVPQM